MDRHHRFRERLKEDEEKLRVYREKAAERQRRWRQRNATVTQHRNATVADRNATHNATPEDRNATPVTQRNATPESAYAEILSGVDVEFPPQSEGGKHASSGNQGRSFSEGESCLRSTKVVEDEWHSIWEDDRK